MNYRAFLFILFAFTLSSCGENSSSSHPTEQLTGQPTEDQAEHAKISYVKSVHYFADAWPKTFWQEFEESQVNEDLQKIKADGFNTVVLVVPWMGFELGFEKDSTSSDQRMYARLALLLDAISSEGLNYMLRLGYPHDFTPGVGTDNVKLCLGMYAENQTSTQWLDYLNKVKKVTDQHRNNQVGMLISWEDFWCPHFVFPNYDEQRRRHVAKQLGYGEWLKSKPVDIVKILTGINELNYEMMPVPKRDDPSYFFYIQFIDEMLDQRILRKTQSVFPKTAMEIRVDKDPVASHKGNIWIGHDLYFDEENHRGTYWAPFWGARNEGEKLSLEQVLKNFEYFLKHVSEDGKSTNHVIEQFNFTDNTPYFQNNATIEEGSVVPFLHAAVPLLKKYSEGYGVWAYQDYADNSLYNASFEMGLEGWEVVGDASVVQQGVDQLLSLKSGAKITQMYIPSQRNMLARSYKELTLCVNASTPGEVTILANGTSLQPWSLTKGANCSKINAKEFVKPMQISFGLKAVTDLTIDDIKLYGFVQYLGLYDEFGEAGPFLEAVQQINKKLD